MRRSLLVVSLAVSCLVLGVAVAGAGENWLGSWRLDPAKSSFSPAPGPGIETLTWVKTADGVQLTSEGRDAEGKPARAVYVTKYDGSEVPWTGNPDADASSASKIDDNTYENVWKKGGKVMVTAKVVVSPDGKTLTVTQTGTNAKGQPINIKAVYNKQ